MECWSCYVLFVIFFLFRLSGAHPFDGDDDDLGN